MECLDLRGVYCAGRLDPAVVRWEERCITDESMSEEKVDELRLCLRSGGTLATSPVGALWDSGSTRGHQNPRTLSSRRRWPEFAGFRNERAVKG